MPTDDRALARARDLLRRAPLEPELWTEFLDALAQATGSRGAQLVGVGDGRLVFNLVRGVPEDVFAIWAASGGADGQANPMMRASASAPLLTVLSTDRLLSGAELERAEAAMHVFREHDMPFRYFAMLRRDGDLRLSLCLFRSQAQGALDPEAEAVFESVLRPTAEAVALQARLNGRASLTARTALDAMGHAGFVLDAFGRVLAATAAGSAMAADGGPLTIRNDRLAFTDPGLARAAAAAAAQALSGTGPHLATSTEPPVWVVEFHPLPHLSHDHGAAPACLAVVRADARRRGALDEAGLTMAERAVADGLLRGCSTRDIAAERRVSVETVRGQMKSIYAKLGVAGRSEFMARFR